MTGRGKASGGSFEISNFGDEYATDGWYWIENGKLRYVRIRSIFYILNDA